MRRFTTVNSRVNSSESNNPNTSNRDNVIGNSYLTHINVHAVSYFNKIINLQKETGIESIISINNEITNEKISEEISSHQNSVELIYYTCDDNGNNVLNT